ncbi:MAG: MerR family transcriptional regulator [Steroidobacteraceae bacterium]
MFRIGDFSRIARVSCRLLRYYDELGLLKPSGIEVSSGYRTYTPEQFGRLNRILVLKDLGFTLEEVARIIENQLSADELRGMLLMRRNEVSRSVETEIERLRHIESRIAQIEVEGQLTSDDVVLRQEPQRRLLSVRRTVGSFAEGGQLIGELKAAVTAAVPSRLLGALTAVAHSAEFEFDCIDIEVGFVLYGAVEQQVTLADGSTLTQSDMPAARMATCVRVGLPQSAHLISAKIGRFVQANGYRLGGASREVFLQPPDPQRMQDSVVEMQYPIVPIDEQLPEAEPAG